MWTLKTIKPQNDLVRSEGDLVTCVECGAEMGTSKLCQRCGAPVVVRPGQATSTARVGQTAPKRPGRWIVGIVAAVVNVIAMWLAISGLVVYATQGTPSEEGQNYIPLWAVLFVAIVFGIVPVLTVVFLVRGLRRRARERRALASSAPSLLPENLG